MQVAEVVPGLWPLNELFVSEDLNTGPSTAHHVELDPGLSPLLNKGYMG